MASKSKKAKPKKPAKLKDKAKKVVGSIMGAVGGKSKSKGTKRKKKSALWYAKEIQRLDLKRKYDKRKMRI
jgi:hypothetical protein